MGNNYEKIDFVIPWVDGSDEVWQKKRQQYSPNKGTDVTESRYRDWDVFNYWFRGVEKFCPWVNHIYLITDRQVPIWLNTEHEKLTVVDHTDYIPEKYLPVFSSHPIELNMNRIRGLAEKFVYFNDDMFILRPIKPTVFFKNNLPCDNAILSPIIMEADTDIGKVSANNMSIINKYFEKNEVIHSNAAKWFSAKYGKQLLRTLCLMPWHHIAGFYNNHLPVAYLKSTFDELWEKEYVLLDETSQHRYRDCSKDVNQWLMRYWQLCKGQFEPISPSRGACFSCADEEATDAIRKQKYAMICINDNESMDEFIRHKKNLHDALDSILPEKSSFERG